MEDPFTTKRRSLKGAIAAHWVPLVVGLLSTLLPACDGAWTADEDAHRPLEMLVTSDAETLDPRYVTDAVGMRTSRLVHAGLTRTDEKTLLPIPYLASAFDWEDARTLHVTLRTGLTFHSGAPFTSEDVVATLQALGDPAVASRHARAVEAIEKVVATGPYDVRITLRRAHATLLSDLEVPILRRDQATLPPDPAGAVLDGLGPFEVVHAGRGEIRLRPSAGGVGGVAHHEVVVRTVHDENARALRLYRGRADVALNALSPTLLPALEGKDGLTVASTPGANLTYLVVRVDRGPLADVRLRRAISLAIDRQTLADTLFDHRAEAANTLLPTSHWASREPASPFPFDLDAARALVREVAPAHLTLLTSTDRLRSTLARTIAQELGDAGLLVDVVPLELGTLIARLNAGDFDLASLQMPELVEPNTLRVFLHSGSVPPAGANRGRIHDAKLDALLDLGDTEVTTERRAEVYREVEALLRAQLFIIPLWHEDQVAVRSARGATFTPGPDGRWLDIANVP